MICRLLSPIPPVALCWFAACGSAAADPAVVSVSDFAGPESFTAGIQEAIDALPAEGGVFRPQQHARLTNYFPLVRGNRFHWDKPLEDVSVADLVLDGNLKENASQVTDFTIAAVHFANNIGRHNGGDGLYFCADVLGIIVTGNLFHDNASNGIGGNLIVGNVCLDNSRAKPGTCSGIALQNATCSTITGNHCSCDGEKPTQKYGIEEIGEADENTITGNQCHGNAQAGIRVAGQGTQAMANGGKVER